MVLENVLALGQSSRVSSSQGPTPSMASCS
jgi:hypothetical protein